MLRVIKVFKVRRVFRVHKVFKASKVKQVLSVVHRVLRRPLGAFSRPQGSQGRPGRLRKRAFKGGWEPLGAPPAFEMPFLGPSRAYAGLPGP